MCVVSNISDWGRTAVPFPDWTRPSWDEYQRLLEKARKLDEMLGQPDCDDTEKQKWMRKVEERLKKLEGK